METGNNYYIEETALKGVLLIKRPVFKDDRGLFHEIFRREDLETAMGTRLEIVQANHSRSSQGTLRGIHIAPWHKLITVPNGKVQQVVVDLRQNSEHFGKHISVTLGEEDYDSILVPPGFGNAYLVISETADYFYMVDQYFAPNLEQDIFYKDPDIKIKWQNGSPRLSARDQQSKTLRQLFPNKF